MATIYLSSTLGSDAFSGATWALAKATMTGAFAIAADGDLIFVDSAHSEVSGAASITLNHPVSGGKLSIISVDRNSSVTTGHNGWLKGATVTVNTNAFGITIASTGAQALYFYGIIFTGNTGASASNLFTVCGTGENTSRHVEFSNCTVTTAGTSTSVQILLGQASSTVCGGCTIALKDTVIGVRNVAGTTIPAIALRTAKVQMSGVTISVSANQPLLLFGQGTDFSGDYEIIDSDLSAYTKSGGAYFDATTMRGGNIYGRNLKLHATPSVVTGTFPNNECDITLVNCDSADTKTVLGFYNRLGTLLATTSVYRTTSPAAQLGSTPVGWQIVTTASCSETEPFVTPWMTNGFDTGTSSKTATVHVVHDSATNMHDRNLWSEVEYVSSASFPIGTLANNRNAKPFDGSAADWATDTDSWTGTGGFSNANKQKVAKTFTPSEGSGIMARLAVGVASKTLYVDPQAVMT